MARDIIGVTLEFVIQSFVALAVNADVSRRIEEVRASQVSYQVIQVSSCPANAIGRGQTTPAHLQLAHSVVGFELTCRWRHRSHAKSAGKCLPALAAFAAFSLVYRVSFRIGVRAIILGTMNVLWDIRGFFKWKLSSVEKYDYECNQTYTGECDK